MSTVYIGLGTNLGDRVQNLRTARQHLAASGIEIRRESALYETAPRDVLDQPWFLNQVVEAETTLPPQNLLTSLLDIERQMGRVRVMDKGPRLIDLDILLYDQQAVRELDLEIPHPRMAERRFVLEPLAELRPDVELSFGPAGAKIKIGELLASVQDQQIRRLV